MGERLLQPRGETGVAGSDVEHDRETVPDEHRQRPGILAIHLERPLQRLHGLLQPALTPAQPGQQHVGLDGPPLADAFDEADRGLFSSLGQRLGQHDLFDRPARLPRLRAPVREHRLGTRLDEALLSERLPQLLHRHARNGRRRPPLRRRGRHPPPVDRRPIHIARHGRPVFLRRAGEPGAARPRRRRCRVRDCGRTRTRRRWRRRC